MFWARMTKIALRSLRLSTAQERLGRIASIAVPPGLIRVLLPPDRGTLICGGTEVRAGNLVTQCAGDSVHERVPAPCCWREIVVPARYLARYSRALTGSQTIFRRASGHGGRLPATFVNWLGCTRPRRGLQKPTPASFLEPRRHEDWNRSLLPALLSASRPVRWRSRWLRLIGTQSLWPGLSRW